jgi:hypothetical protein
MASVNEVIEQVKSQWDELNRQIRIRIIGANNERLDLIMDSFYKLSPQQRTWAALGAVGAVTLVVFSAVALYFASVGSLKTQLTDGFRALHDLQQWKGDYQRESERFDRLADQIARRTRGVRLKPLVEKTAKETDVVLMGLNEQRLSLPAENILSQKIQEVRLDMSIQQVSVPKLMKFLSELEKANSYLNVQDLQIRGRYGTRLYFDAQVKVRGYAAIGE